ncbi:MAG TPA: YhdP family protein, partial [Burkholderiales bacterium]|nr:YhdP family protein [Burkholderiales bacterium]
SAVLNRADGRSATLYVPHVLDPEAREWLTQAVVAGESSDVRVRVRGNLRDFPFVDPATGQFQVTARIEKGVLSYAKGWPRIEDIDGELTFERDGMVVVARSGTVLGARLSGVRAQVPSFKGAARRVLVSGQADGATAEFLKYLESSPLSETAGSFVTSMKAEGRGKLRLKLELPLADLKQTKVAGEYEFAANRVKVLDELPPIDEAAGRLTFTDDGFTLQGVRGRLLGGSLTASGASHPRRGVEIVVRGDATVEQARTVPPLDHPLAKHLSGAFAYVVNVQAKDGLARVSLESPLRGVESALPAPLAKKAIETLPLRAEFIPTASGERDRIVIALGTLARVELARRKQGNSMQVQRTAYWLSPERDQPIRLPERPGTLFYGALPAFDLERWLPLLAGDAQGGNEATPTAVEVRFGTLDAFGRRFSNVALRASTDAAGWSANVKADEVSGDVSFRNAGGGRLIARLARFTIPADVPSSAPAAAGGQPRPAPKPSELPAIDLVAEEFTFRGKQLGRVEMVARPDGDNWRIESASMVNPEASLTGSGMWYAAPSRTNVQFDLQAGDTGGFLARVGYPDLVKGARTHMRGALAWQGDPATLDLPTLAGELEMQSNDGQFLEIEPGVGKLISLMSLQALPKRITLDFRDVFSKGFQFDRIVSNAQLQAGVMKLQEFRMRGSAADVDMKGETDLARETQNLQVRVVPSLALGDTAALGIGIVNPVAGVAAAIAQRLLKNPLGQIFAFDYAVSGTWSDPKVSKIVLPVEPPLTTGQ